jgi:hypothetical protein
MKVVQVELDRMTLAELVRTGACCKGAASSWQEK